MNYDQKRVLMHAQRLTGLLALANQIEDPAAQAKVLAKCGLVTATDWTELQRILSDATDAIAANSPAEVGAVLASEISRARSGLRRAITAVGGTK